MSERDALIIELRRQIADLTRHNEQLREAISALLQPAPSELLPRNLAHPSRVSRNFTLTPNSASQ